MYVHFNRLTEDLYNAYLLQCRELNISTLFLPQQYISDLWGIIAVNNDQIKGGWVGKLRGNKPIARYFVKGVWFDSLPVIFENSDPALFDNMLDYAKKLARKDGIVTFNVTHWSRQQLFDKKIFDKEENNATFFIRLDLVDIEYLWKNISSKLRNIIRKGEKNNIKVLVEKGEKTIEYLERFQQLREETQSRAIKKNTKASMLLKPMQFFAELLLQENSYLFVAKYEDELVAMALMIKNAETMYYFSGGSDLEANKKTGASSYLIWKAIEFAKDSDVKIFDLGGVPVNPDSNHPAYGVYYFKKSFGGEYKEFSSGKIIIRKKIYPVLNYILNNRFILRILSKVE
jgi:lipid II:glycine glycyltransferase (peptidoglycan interpeptide bridge formation enzyme)